MITQDESLLMCLHPHLSVEQVTPSEIEQGEGVLVHRVVFEVDSVVSTSLETADAHIGHRTTTVIYFWDCYMVCNKFATLKL